MKKGRVHRPHIVVPSISGTTQQQRKPRKTLDGKRVNESDLYDAETFLNATSFRAYAKEGTETVELSVADAEIARLLLTRHRGVLVYAVTAKGRTACITRRTLRVCDMMKSGE